MKRITKIEENMLLEKRKLRVAAYCRVSTARDEQCPLPAKIDRKKDKKTE